MKTYGVILSGGKSSRFHGTIKKQFYLIKDKPVLYYSLKTFNDASRIDEIILVATKEDFKISEELVQKYNFRKVTHVVIGGYTRQESVHSGLEAIKDEDGKVLIHDAARPLVDEDIINKLIDKLDEYDGAAPALKVFDTIIKVENEELVSFENRDLLYRIQTPQAFKLDVIKEAHRKFNDLNATDDTQLVKLLSKKVAIIEGKEKFRKITKLEDTNAIEAYIEKNEYLQS